MVISNPNIKIKKVFLAGPIQGAPDWHEKMMEELKDENIIIASPKRAKDKNFNYDEQVDWETNNLESADIIIFYLAKEKEVIPGRSYAQTSRFELGENLARIHYCKTNQKVIVYGEEGFFGLSYLKLKIESDKYHDFASYYSNREEFLKALKDEIKK